jgi:hypothetical protein
MLSKNSASTGNIGNPATKVKVKTDTFHPTLENVGFRVDLEIIYDFTGNVKAIHRINSR